MQQGVSANTHSSLPQPLTSLIGRERDVENVCRLLMKQEARLVTLTGPGGVGKTRLALEVGHRIALDDSEEVIFISVQSLSDPDSVAPEMARNLGVRDFTERTPLEGIIANLQFRRLLLVIDNFEHVVGAAPILSEILGGCKEVRFLVTSRTRLNLNGEHVYSVLPLPTAELTVSSRLLELHKNPAIQLFRERAQAVQSDFQLTDENSPHVSALCAGVDGLPLAIELVASQSRVFSAAALRRMLEQNPASVNSGPVDAPGRHRSLWSAIGWSFDLLGPDLQRFLACLSIFQNGFTVEAASQVCGHALGSGDSDSSSCSDGLSTIRAISTLAENSLIIPAHGANLEDRFSMLITIREFSLEKLAEIDLERCVRQRHSEYFMNLAHRAEGLLRGPEQQKWLDRLEVDHENILLGLKWATENNREAALRAGISMWFFWLVHGHLREGRAFFRAALADTSNISLEVRAKATDAAAGLASWQGDFELAEQLFSEALELFRELGADLAIANTLRGIGRLAMASGDFDLAEETCRESVEIFDRFEHSPQRTAAVMNLGWNAMASGSYERAEEILTRAKHLAESDGDRAMVIANQAGLGFVSLEVGDIETAEDRLREVIIDSLEVGDPRFVAMSLEGLGRARKCRDQHLSAARLLTTGMALRETIGLPRREACLAPQTERDLAIIRAHLGADRFEEIQEQSRLLGWCEAASIALDETAPTWPETEKRMTDAGLTRRELEVLKLMAEGKTDNEIASDLFISRFTVMRHVSHILGKLDTSTRTAAATKAVRLGLV